MRKSIHALTLIELLVVIAIVGVLAALLFPVFSRAKRAAHASSALSQLGQIGKGIAVYAADHDDLLPYAAGNNCFHLAVNVGRGCGTFDPAEVRAVLPINAALQRYRVPWEVYRSSVDSMSVILLRESGHKATWYEETATPDYPGSSFEFTLLGLQRTSFGGLTNPAQQPLMTSLYRLGDGSASLFHVQFADGHTKSVSSAQAHSNLNLLP